MTPPITLLHRLWRRLPAGSRRRMATRLAALAAPRPSAPPPVAAGGVIVAGELSRASGLGESARLMLRGLAALGVPTWPIDIGRYLPAHRNDLPQPPQPDSSPPSGAPLVLHVNPPLLPLVLARLPPSHRTGPPPGWILGTGNCRLRPRNGGSGPGTCITSGRLRVSQPMRWLLSSMHRYELSDRLWRLTPLRQRH